MREETVAERSQPFAEGLSDRPEAIVAEIHPRSTEKRLNLKT